ncbi:MAG: response regulator [Syntrophobacteraceae bacterium]
MEQRLTDVNKPTVVVVGDDASQLAIISGLLEEEGFDIRTYRRAVDAIREMDPRRPPDLIVTDLYTPDLDGWRFCRLLRSEEYAPFGQTPIMVTSATATREEARIANGIGANALIPSPMDASRFIEEVRVLLRGEKCELYPNILVIENEEPLAAALMESFASKGCAAERVKTVHGAIEALQKQHYDAVLLDRDLSDGPGEGVLEEIRQHQPGCPCIIMADAPTPENTLQWMKAGAAAYLRKPIEPERLVESCLQVCQEQLLMRLKSDVEDGARRLRESEEKFRNTFQNAPLGLFRSTLEGRFLEVNQALAEGLGFDSPREVLSEIYNLGEQIYRTPEDRARIVRETLTSRQQMKFESRFHRRDGSEITVDLYIRAIRDDAGNPCYLEGIVHDVTQRKRAEEDLAAQKRTLQTIIDGIPDAVALMNPDYSIIAYNKTGYELKGKPEEVHGRKCFELLGRNHPCSDCPAATALRTGRIAKIEKQISEPSRWVTARAIPIPGSDGGVEMIVMQLRDITERKHAEGERERLMSAIEQVGEAIVITDPTGAIQYVNPAFEKITGYTREEVFGQNPRVLKSGKHEDAFYEKLWQVISNGDTWEGRFINRKKDGSHYIEAATISPVHNQSNSIINYVAVKRDITADLLLKEEKERLDEQYRHAQKTEAIGRLAGGVAHDLNNLLTPILGYSDMLLDDMDWSDENREALEEIRKAGLRARDLVQRLLAFGRKQTLNYQSVDLNEVLAGFEKLLRRTIREDIRIKFLRAPSVTPIRADVGQLELVIMNLAVNAQDAMPNGGEITVETAISKLDASHAMPHEDLRPGEYALLSVKDTGSGISSDVREHIFEPFFSTKGEAGTGLGLATVYGIVRQHGGMIQVESETGKGSVFRIHLPVWKEDAPQEEAPEAPPSRTRGAETILLVEDDEQVRHLAQAILERRGYKVLPAENGSSALALLDALNEPVHLILTDVIMPEMNGKELCAKASARRPGTKALYMSGYTNNVINNGSALEESVHFIQKPFTPEGLTAKVREILDAQ